MPVCLPVAISHLPITDEEWQNTLAKDYESHKELWGYETNVYRRPCATCGRQFYARRPEAKWCSYRCRNDGYIQRRRERAAQARQKVCLTCKAAFTATRRDSRFCGPACKQAAYRKRSLQVTVLPTLSQHGNVTGSIACEAND